MSARQTAPRPKRRRASAPADRFEAQARRAETARPDSAPPRIDAAPAGPRLSGLGSGRPLPGAARQRAETALGADLGAVRLHTGPAAAPHLEATGVAAMAAGPDILATEAARLDRPEGEPLLLHELAHVLQQTGLRGPDGRLRATPRHGRGRAYGVGGPLEGEDAPERENLVEYLHLRHFTIPSVDPHFAALLDRVPVNFDLEGPDGAALAREVALGQIAGVPVDVASMSHRSRGLLFDLMKFGEHFAQARDLLLADPELQSAAGYAPFQLSLLGDDAVTATLMDALMAEGTEPHRLLTRRWPASVWNYLMGPARGVQAIYDLQEHVARVEAEAGDWRVLGSNDADFIVAQVLDAVNDTFTAEVSRRHEDREFVRTGDSGFSHGRLRFRKFMAENVADWSEEQHAALAGVDGSATVRAGWQAVAATARDAAAYWDAVLDRLTGPERREALPETPALVQFRADLSRTGLHLLETPDGAHLPIRTYERRRVALTRILGTHRQAFERDLYAPRTAEEREPDAGPRLSDDRFVKGVLLGHIAEIEGGLRAYADLAADADAALLANIHLARRIVTARWLGMIGQTIGATDLVDRAETIEDGGDVTTHTLAILSNWTEDRSARLSDMRRETGGSGGRRQPLTYWRGSGEAAEPMQRPISVNDLIALYHLAYSERLVDELDTLLDQPVGTTPQAVRQRSLLQEAHAAARGNDRPVRWEIERFIYIPSSEDERSFHTILDDHNRMNEIDALKRPGDMVLIPINYPGSIYAWAIPDIGPMIRRMRGIDSLNAIVAQRSGVDPDTLDPIPWLNHLTEATHEDADIADAVRADLGSRLQELQDVQDAELEALYPEVMSHERRRLAVLVDDLLTRFADDDLYNYGAPNEAERLIREYLAMVRPPRLTDAQDQPFPHAHAQLAILFLTLSHKLEAAFNPSLLLGLTQRVETRYDIVTGFAPLLRIALEASTSGVRGRLTRFMTEQEAAAIDYTAARQRLQEILTGFEQAAEESQRQMAMIGTRTGLRSNLFAQEVQPSTEPFRYEGVNVRLIAVHRPFVFLPAYGPDGERVRDPQVTDADGSPLGTNVDLASFQIEDNDPVHVTSDLSNPDNLRNLEMLSDIVSNQAFIQGLEDLAVAIETAAEIGLDLAEFIPVAGQALMVARIVMEVAQFIQSDEFEEMLGLLRGDPVAALRQMATQLQEQFFDPDAIWRFLIFEAPVLGFLSEPDEDDERRRRRRPRSTAARFARIAAQIADVPVTLVARLTDVQERVHPRVVSVQSMVAGNPAVGSMLLLAAMIARDAPAFLAQVEGVRDALSGDGLEAMLQERIGRTMAALDQLELPREPIPNEMVIAAMIDFTMDRLERMGKFGTAIRLSAPVLEALGAYEQIAELIAPLVEGTALDPNEVWRDEVLTDLLGAFDAAKASFKTSLDGMLTRFGVPPLAPPAATQQVDRAMVEVSPSLDPARLPHAGAALGQIGAGRPMPRSLVQRTAREFGHDFSHVRLHQSDDAGRLTARYGARALTSGSHVFLRPGLSPERGEGAGVLRHELGHVLQQAGPSPLGTGPRQAPSLGRPQRGLRLNPAEEAAADRAAASAMAPGHRIGRPVSAGRGAADGLAPDLGVQTLADILERFAEPADISAFQADVDRTARRTGRAALRDTPGRQQADRIWADFSSRLDTATGAQRGRQIRNDDAWTAIKAHVRAWVDAETSAGHLSILALAKMAQRPLSSPGSGDDTPQTELNRPVFVNLLEAFIFAETGLTVSINLEDSGAIRGIEAITFRSFDPGRVEPMTADVWTTFFAATDTYLGRRTRAPRGSLNMAQKLLIYHAARLRRPNETLVASGAFRADLSFLRRIMSLESDIAGMSMMPWADYVHVDANNPMASGPGGHGGDSADQKLRLGTHSQLTALDATHRDSHHMPQFLFVEYFTNNNDSNRMFERTAAGRQERLPGFEESDTPSSFTGGGATIRFGDLYPGRGGGVPAVYLARRTHQTGRLHVGRADTWPPDGDQTRGTPASHSAQFHTVFRDHAVDRIRAVAPASERPALGNSFASVARWANEHDTDVVRGAVRRAIRDTYRWMYHGVMRPALDRALRTEEPRFYIAAMIAQNGTGPLPASHDPARNPTATAQVMTKLDSMQNSDDRFGGLT